jgi:hypothetical protein
MNDLLEEFQELNLNNYDDDGVRRLNNWAINAYDTLKALEARLASLTSEIQVSEGLEYQFKNRITELEALCLNALYHHQGASSVVGQPIRKALGMGKCDYITEAQQKIICNVRAPYAVISEENQSTQWQPIETAPKNETLLGFVPHSMGGYLCPIAYSKSGAWFNASCANYSRVKPSHWKPASYPTINAATLTKE